MDVPLPDEAPLLRSATARALFICPILVSLARPECRTAAEFALVLRLARRWAGRVGFRLEEGALVHDGKNGPSLWLTERHWVRLVTHRLQRRLGERLRDLAALAGRPGARLPRGLSLESTRALIEDLEHHWVNPARCPGSRRAARADATALRLSAASGAAGSEKSHQAGVLALAASRSYIYGRFEQNTIIRMALGELDRDDRWAPGPQAPSRRPGCRSSASRQCSSPHSGPGDRDRRPRHRRGPAAGSRRGRARPAPLGGALAEAHVRARRLARAEDRQRSARAAGSAHRRDGLARRTDPGGRARRRRPVLPRCLPVVADRAPTSRPAWWCRPACSGDPMRRRCASPSRREDPLRGAARRGRGCDRIRISRLDA